MPEVIFEGNVKETVTRRKHVTILHFCGGEFRISRVDGLAERS
jgi:hypothetical protein